MSLNADILAALQRDVPAAKYDGKLARLARARIAALDGPALLAALMTLLADERISCDDCPSCLDSAAHRVIADAAKALGL